ncbi:archaellin/type IV pilin N-terminal domain-containing protein [Methanolobus sp. WCC4]|uniref:archaellin/type IV pilin N-terminal domain-containing protein n=1 Tax=Methanolobus sp. WCC4 TaxID=3125784 RepID=UPI0030F62064
MHIEHANKTRLKNNTKGQIGIGTLIIFIAMVLVAAVAASVLIQTSGVLQQKAQSTGKEATKEVSSNLMVQKIEGYRAKNSASDMAETLDLLKITIGLNAASEPVDLKEVVISITDGFRTNNLIYAGNTNSRAPTPGVAGNMSGFSDSPAINLEKALTENSTLGNPGANVTYVNSQTYFTVEKIRDEDDSFSQSQPVLTTGDFVVVYVPTVSQSSVDAGYTTLKTINVSSTLKSSGLNLEPRATVNIVVTPETGASSYADFILPTTFGSYEMVQLYP